MIHPGSSFSCCPDVLVDPSIALVSHFLSEAGLDAERVAERGPLDGPGGRREGVRRGVFGIAPGSLSSTAAHGGCSNAIRAARAPPAVKR